MAGLLTGLKPDITPAQVIAVVIAGVPQLLVLFGVELSAKQDDALDQLLLLGLGLFGADVLLRGARNMATAKIEAAALTPVPAPAQLVAAPAAGQHVEATPEHIATTGAAQLAAGGDSDGVEDGPLDDEERALLDELNAGAVPDSEEFGEGPEPESRVTPDSPEGVAPVRDGDEYSST